MSAELAALMSGAAGLPIMALVAELFAVFDPLEPPHPQSAAKENMTPNNLKNLLTESPKRLNLNECDVVIVERRKA
jgi:hypothetical protein